MHSYTFYKESFRFYHVRCLNICCRYATINRNNIYDLGEGGGVIMYTTSCLSVLYVSIQRAGVKVHSFKPDAYIDSKIGVRSATATSVSSQFPSITIYF